MVNYTIRLDSAVLAAGRLLAKRRESTVAHDVRVAYLSYIAYQLAAAMSDPDAPQELVAASVAFSELWPAAAKLLEAWDLREP
jgi:hypothetical protein